MGESCTIPTEMFTRQIRQNLKSATAKITDAPKNPLIFKSVIPTGALALFSRHKGTLPGNLTELPIRNSEEFEVGNGKKYLHPKKIPSIF